MKDTVYETSFTSADDLLARVVEAAASVHDRPGVFERIRQSMIHRCQVCIVADGGHFENHL